MKLAIGVAATMAVPVLGLPVSFAKGSFDQMMGDELTQTVALASNSIARCSSGRSSPLPAGATGASKFALADNTLASEIRGIRL